MVQVVQCHEDKRSRLILLPAGSEVESCVDNVDIVFSWGMRSDTPFFVSIGNCAITHQLQHDTVYRKSYSIVSWSHQTLMLHKVLL